MTELKKFDVIVIGGGINGAAIARDSALRGLQVALFEKGDFGSGTTQFSSRLIHGGLRYLEQFEFGLVFEALQEREYLLKTAPHLVRPLHFLIPNYIHSTRDLWYLRLGMWGYDVLSILKSLPWHSYFKNALAMRLLEPGIEMEGLRGGVAYYDGQVNFPERLCVANVLQAEKEGAVVVNYTEVVKVLVDEKNVKGVRVRDVLSGKEEEDFAKMVVNASGPWVDKINELLPMQKLSVEIGGTKGSHIVVKEWKNAPRRAIYVEAYADRRPIFIIPWRGYMLIGTTDILYKGNLDQVYPTRKEAEYFILETNRLFPDADLDLKKIISAYAGVRPLPAVRREAPGDIPRSHIIHDYNDLGITGYISIISGKITTNRSLAEEAVNDILKKLGRTGKRCVTRRTALVGGEITNIEKYTREQVGKIEKEYGLERAQGEYLVGMFGTEWGRVLEYGRRERKLLKKISKYHPDVFAEVHYCVAVEKVKRVSDFLLRRCGIGTGEGQGLDCVEDVATEMGKLLGWDTKRIASEVFEYKKEVKERYTVH